MLTVYDPCPCNSGKKFKFCCGDRIKTKDPGALCQQLGLLPLHMCLINGFWKENGIASIHIIKGMHPGHFVLGMYLIDIWCLGVKDADLKMNLTQSKVDYYVDKLSFVHVDFPYEDARSIIFGSLEYAQNLGFTPHADWHMARCLIEPDRSFQNKVTFGRNGKPFYKIGPYDAKERNTRDIVDKMRKAGGSWDLSPEN
jgi:hypothetical protein